MRRFTRFAAAIAAAILPAAAFAATGSFTSSSPSPLSYLLDPGASSTGSVSSSVQIAGGGEVDIFFVTDTTGSMGGQINAVKTGFSAIATKLSTDLPGVSFHFGAADFKDKFDTGYFTNKDVHPKIGQNLTSNFADVQTAINAWSASGGGDGPEANLDALKDISDKWLSSYGGRDTAQKLIIYTADVIGWENGSFGYDYPTLQGTINALKARNATVFALSNTVAGSGIDAVGQASGGAGPADGRKQGSTLAAETGGQIFYSVNFSNTAGVADTIASAISTGAETINNITVSVSGDLGSWLLGVSDTPVAGPFSKDDSPVLSDFGLNIKAPGFADTRTVKLELRADGALLDTLDVLLSTKGGEPPAIPLPPAVLMGLSTMGLATLGSWLKRRAM